MLCRIYKKSGTGPKNGEQYGAPVEEEEWDILPTRDQSDNFNDGLGTYFSTKEAVKSNNAESLNYDIKQSEDGAAMILALGLPEYRR